MQEGPRCTSLQILASFVGNRSWMFLIVSTDTFVSKVCATVAAAYGYEVEVAGSHEEAVARTRALPPAGSLVLVDLYMKSGRGEATWERLLQIRPDVNFLFMGLPKGAVASAKMKALPADRIIARVFTADVLLNHLARFYTPEVRVPRVEAEHGAVKHLAQRLSNMSSIVGRLEFLSSHWVASTARYQDVAMIGYPAAEVHGAYAHLHAAAFEHWLCLEMKDQIFDYRRYLRSRPAVPAPVGFPTSLAPAHAPQPQREHFLMQMALVIEACEGRLPGEAERSGNLPE